MNAIKSADMILAEVDKVYLETNSMLKANERRYELLIEKNKQLLEQLLAHDFFKICQTQGDSTGRANRDCLEILLAFLHSHFINAEKATLPSSLEKFASMKIPYNMVVFNMAFFTLSFMVKIFKGRSYVCKAIDFICMSIIVSHDKSFNDEMDNLSERETQVLFDEYVKMWNELDPSVTLSPLVKENLDIILSYIGLIVRKVKDSVNHTS
jgi:hypothetical protein